jgi:hypothetical protein
VRVIRYHAVERERVQAFVDIKIGILRLNGLHLMRDGSLEAARLTPLIHNKRAFIPAVEILDPRLLESLTTAIQEAIQEHLKTLPPEQRVKPPRPPESRQPDKRPVASAKPLSAVPIKPKLAGPAVAKPPAGKPKLPPPVRLLANFPRRTP